MVNCNILYLFLGLTSNSNFPWNLRATQQAHGISYVYATVENGIFFPRHILVIFILSKILILLHGTTMFSCCNTAPAKFGSECMEQFHNWNHEVRHTQNDDCWSILIWDHGCTFCWGCHIILRRLSKTSFRCNSG